MAEWWENQLPTPTERPEHWVMYFDGSLKLEGAGAGVLLISPTCEQLQYVLQIFCKVSNNKAEYESLLHRLRLAASLGIKRLLVYGDSQWSSTKSTSPGTATRRTWMPTA
jgi:ribonuclease HI